MQPGLNTKNLFNAWSETWLSSNFKVWNIEEYEDWHRRRISAKPGITGLWQISGRNEITDFVEVVKLDLKYIDTWLFRKDLWILWKTIWVVLGRKGAR